MVSRKKLEGDGSSEVKKRMQLEDKTWRKKESREMERVKSTSGEAESTTTARKKRVKSASGEACETELPTTAGERVQKCILRDVGYSEKWLKSTSRETWEAEF